MRDRREEFVVQHQLLDRSVRGDERPTSVADLQRYFREDGPATELFTGRWFERFGAGGDAPDVANVMTAADVLALSHLGISERLSELAMAVLSEHAERISGLLSAIPIVALHEVSEADYPAMLGEQSQAWGLWEILRTCAGVDRWVMASKLLARKRPHLLPVYDSVVKEQLGGTNQVWKCLWLWFQADTSRAAAVEELRAEAGGIEDISLLRCLDVVLWMRGRRAQSMK